MVWVRKLVVVAVLAGVLTGLGGGPRASADEPAVRGGSAIAFGADRYGETEVPDLPAGVTYTDVAAGRAHTVLLRSDGNVVAFGDYDEGQTDVPDLEPGVAYTDVAAGDYHTVLLRSDGTVKAFGYDRDGRTDVPEPPAGMTYTDVAAGWNHTVLLRSDGNVVAFGYNRDGQTDVPDLEPGVVYTDVAAGAFHTVLLRSDGTVKAFGYDRAGRTDVPEPPAGMTYTDVAAGQDHTVLLRSDGNAVAFGDDDGDGRTDVPDLEPGVVYTDVAAGTFHTVLLRSDGKVEAFGYNDDGQTNVPEPPEGMVYTDVAAGGWRTVLLRSAVETEVSLRAPDSITATDGEVEVSADVGAAGETQPDVAFTGTVRLSIDGKDPIDIAVDDDGAATTTIDGLPTTAGTTIEVSATYLGSTDGAYLAAPAPARRDIEITPAPAATIELSPVSEDVVAGESVTYTVTGTDRFGNDLGDLTDTTTINTPDTDAGAEVDGDTVTFTTTGSHTFTAALDTDPEVTTTATVDVTPAPAATIELSPSTEQVVAGESVTYTVTGADRFGNDLGDLTDTTTINTPDTDAGAEVDGDTVTFTTTGSHTVTAALDTDPEVTTTATVDVTAAPLAAIELRAPEGLNVDQGGSLTFTVDGTDTYGNPVEIGDEAVELASDHPDDSIDGLTVTFPEASPHRITATVDTPTDTLTDTVTVEVTPASVPQLPETGADTLTTLATAALALLLGTALTLTAARRTARKPRRL
ncbi:hypothetical protein GCM10023169_08100 [Georgenia halophila]|uniref:LPXTG cell wall anchor domain-containing protein n=1 Tax=Georgenia halophila TaxID=620889 RepID=A0ABP8KY55_9MICO